MYKVSKPFKQFLRRTKQVEYEKGLYEKAARIERPRREPRMSGDDLSLLLTVLAMILPFCGLMALAILK